MNRAKLIVAATLALLVLIVVLQNTQAVETKVLFLSFTLPRAVLLTAATLVGFILGVLTSFRGGSKATKR